MTRHLQLATPSGAASDAAHDTGPPGTAQLRLVFNCDMDDVDDVDDTLPPARLPGETEEQAGIRLASFHAEAARRLLERPSLHVRTAEHDRVEELLEPYEWGPEREAAFARLYQDADGVWQIRTLRIVNPDQQSLDDV